MNTPTPPEIQVARPVEPRAEDADPLSKSITQSITALLASNVADRNEVGRVLGIKWNADESSPGVYQGIGIAENDPFVHVRLESEEQMELRRVKLTIELSDASCYDARALVFNSAPDHVETPYAVADGDVQGIVGRGYFDANGKRVLLAYRQGDAQQQCVTEIVVKQPGGG